MGSHSRTRLQFGRTVWSSPTLPIILTAILANGVSQTAVAADASLRKTDIFESGKGGYHTYRIPAVVVSPNGTVLVFCEGRKSSRSDDGDIDMLLRRSTDGGRTWLPVQMLHEEGTDASIKFGNPCPVVDVETGAVLLVMNRSLGATRTERAGGDILIMSSDDHGKSWSPPRDITKQVKRPAWKHYAEGPGIGIQLRHGSHKGRLIVPANYRESFNNRDPSFSHVMFSDDHGESWQLGGVVGPHTNECQVAEIVENGNPGLLINMRNHWGRAGRPELSGKRLVSRSFDGGVTWSEAVVDTALIEPICQASLLSYSTAKKKLLLFCNPASSRRDHLTVRSSGDEGRTWTDGRIVEEGTAAYSCLTQLSDGDIGLVYERDDYKRLTFARFTDEWISSAR